MRPLGAVISILRPDMIRETVNDLRGMDLRYVSRARIGIVALQGLCKKGRRREGCIERREEEKSARISTSTSRYLYFSVSKYC